MDDDLLPNERFYGARGFTLTRTEWVKEFMETGIKPKPPNSWLEAQDAKGRAAAKFNIWWRYNDPNKRFIAWMLAPLDDFRAAGYLVTR